MSRDVKTTDDEQGRRYDTTRRRASARITRRRVLDAAITLFEEHGYGATSLQAIADEADVSVQTIYATFTNKRNVLTEALDVAIAGDDEAVAVNDRDWMSSVWTAPTATERLEAYAHAVTRIMSTAGPMFLVVAAAAATDPELVDVDDEAERRRRSGSARVVDSILEVGALAAHLDPNTATDVLWALNSPQLHDQLVRRAGWSTDRYREWLAGAMRRELLPPAVVGAADR